jgi:hypothetical protein
MLRDGDVDAVNIGVMGGYLLLHNNAAVRPLAIQKRSFRRVLIANTRTFPGNATHQSQGGHAGYGSGADATGEEHTHKSPGPGIVH